MRCGNVIPCKLAASTDDIYCAFRACPNQCRVFFMLLESLGASRLHMALMAANLGAGHAKAAVNELRKAQNVVRDAVLPELEELGRQIVDKEDRPGCGQVPLAD